MIRVSRALLVGIVLLSAATSAWAQATAQINGTVADSSGGVLPGVTVVAIQTETGFRRETVIDNEAVEALPLEGRNPASLIILAGGAVDTGNPSSRSLTGSRGIAIAGGQQFGVAY